MKTLNESVYDNRWGYSFGTMKLLDRVKAHYPTIVGPNRKTILVKTEDGSILWKQGAADDRKD